MSKFEDKCQVFEDNHEDRENGIFPPMDKLDPRMEKEGPKPT